MTNLVAATATVAALRNAGKLDDVDEARIQAFVSLASAVDGDPLNASLWREYRAAEATLREVTDDGSDEFEAIVARLSPPVRDEAEPGKGNAGRRSRSRG